MRAPARFWAFFDLAVTSVLAVPPLARILIESVYAISGRPFPGFENGELFFVCLSGIIGVVWAVARIQVEDPRLTRIDIVGRLIVAVLILGFLYVEQVPQLLWLFVGTELAGAAHQALAARETDR